MKKVLSILLTLCLVFSALPMSVFATATANASQVSTLTSGDWSYEFYGEGVCLTAYNGTAQDLTVPDKITVGDNEYQVLKLGDGLFQNSTTLNSATFGSGILEIGASAFKNCTNLVCVILNEELTTIGAEAFYGCTSFNSVIIYDAVTQISENAFYNCSSLTVWCNENSYAYDYAIANNIPYEILNPEEIPQTFVLDGNTYYISNGTATLMSLTEADTVVIPASVDGCPVTAMTTGAISTSIYADDMSVYFPETLVNIPDDFTLRDRIIACCTQGSAIQKYFEQNHNRIFW